MGEADPLFDVLGIFVLTAIAIGLMIRWGIGRLSRSHHDH